MFSSPLCLLLKFLNVTGSKEDVDVRSSLLETNGAVAPAELAKHGSLSKRDSYANFEVQQLAWLCSIGKKTINT